MLRTQSDRGRRVSKTGNPQHARAGATSLQAGAQPNASCMVTTRQKQVLQLMSGGLRNKEIAFALDIAEHTVDAHLKKIFRKFSVRDRTAAVVIALRHGLIDL